MNGKPVIFPALAAALLATWAVGQAGPGEQPAVQVFAHTAEAMQLLEARCIRCHDQAKSRGNLDLTTRDRLLRGGETGPAVVPGEPAKSLLYRLVTSADESAMPKTGPKLTAPQRALVKSWIKAGAPYDRTLGKAGLEPIFRLPNRRFHRNQGIYAGLHFDVDGNRVDDKTWSARKSEWLPTPEDRDYVRSLMHAVTEPGKIAGWIAPPTRGINSQPFEFQYVKHIQ